MKNKIPRSTFIAAIEAGIQRAGASITDHERAALREVGLTAKEVGSTYAEVPSNASGTGCPWSLAGFSSSGIMGEASKPFTQGYDSAIYREIKSYGGKITDSLTPAQGLAYIEGIYGAGRGYSPLMAEAIEAVRTGLAE